MKLLLIPFAIVILTAITFASVAAVTTISGPTQLALGEKGTWAVSGAVTVSFPKYLSGSPGTCAFGVNTTTLRRYDCPAGGSFSITAPLTAGAFSIRASDGASLSVAVGFVVPSPSPAPTPTPPAAPTFTNLGGGTFQIDAASTTQIQVRFPAAADTLASDCAPAKVRVGGTFRRVGVNCIGALSYRVTLSGGPWTVTATQNGRTVTGTVTP